MILLSVNLNSILENIISNLSVGLILGVIGYFIWKKQHHYYKKVEVFTELLPHLLQLQAIISNEQKGLPTKEKMMEIINHNIYVVKPLQEKFIICFGEKYRVTIDEIFNKFAEITNEMSKTIAVSDNLQHENNKYVDERIEIIKAALKN